MQLNKLVTFHKVMGDATRIRILALLSKGPKNGQTLSGILGLTPPTITHHLTKLREISLISEKRVKNTIYFQVNEKLLQQLSLGMMEIVTGKGELEVNQEKTAEHTKILGNYLTKDGKLKTIPPQRKRRLIVLYHLAKGFEAGKKYPEKEINEYIKRFHEDFATIRREFIVNHIMYRENSIYELNPKELWAKIE
ncbi:metalloregulator ArsR/SmtB family transcription factor [Metabacillus idriensis]|uniref:Metalloregulator ArsR/SmtB family transcription factor n=1 Tax=Metabacillus idriensis TaxID=324768 RepID=A0A6I2M9Z2_9BACI|nr:metalloregulator ArsR/SmtB family transcription factor [Metabacillus idriensis]MCM3594726.1 metalloregulator ArsR/SmtB family transcription factor [Metabacillus idriensis]MRX53251.1 metalloregulator ArsR/SmtB family transcription factor [Metabacillus idriensis]OHR69250.1 ArsR family transcriptional regulator [Bacillus sp. HMSC76G11]